MRILRYQWQRCILFLLAIFRTSIFRISLTGGAHLRTISDSVIFVSDHHSYFDPFCILIALPRRQPFFPIRPLTWRGLFFVPGLNILLWLFGCIAVQTGKKLPLDHALKRASNALSSNESLLIFPEGKRTKDRTIQHVRRGAPYLALVTGKTVLPLAVHGAEQGLSFRALFSRPRILITVGEPIVFTQKSFPTPEDLSVAGEHIRSAIAHCQASSPHAYIVR